MASKSNPYQPPASNSIKTSCENYWVEENFLVVPLGENTLPHRCVYCNKTVEKLKKRKLFWRNPIISYSVIAIFIGLFFFTPTNYLVTAILGYFLLDFFIRKKAILYLGVCKEHNKQIIMKVVAGLIFVVLGILLIYGSRTMLPDVVSIIGLFFIITSLIYMTRIYNILTIKKVKNRLVYLTRCGQSFLDSFPKQ